MFCWEMFYQNVVKMSWLLVYTCDKCSWGAGMAQWWERLSPTNVALVQFWHSAIYGLVFDLAPRIFHQVLWFSSLYKNQHFNWDRGSTWKLSKTDLASSLNIVIYWLIDLIFHLYCPPLWAESCGWSCLMLKPCWKAVNMFESISNSNIKVYLSIVCFKLVLQVMLNSRWCPAQVWQTHHVYWTTYLLLQHTTSRCRHILKNTRSPHFQTLHLSQLIPAVSFNIFCLVRTQVYYLVRIQSLEIKGFFSLHEMQY